MVNIVRNFTAIVIFSYKSCFLLFVNDAVTFLSQCSLIIHCFLNVQVIISNEQTERNWVPQNNPLILLFSKGGVSWITSYMFTKVLLLLFFGSMSGMVFRTMTTYKHPVVFNRMILLVVLIIKFSLVFLLESKYKYDTV